MLSKKKVSFEQYVNPLINVFSSVDPNLLTVIGSIPSLLFFVFVIMHWYMLALVAFLGNVFDLVDGMVARKFNKVTAFGGVLDSTMDRVADFLIITSFAFGGLAHWEIVMPLLLFAFLTSYIRSRGELAAKNAITFAIGMIERPERLVIIFLALSSYVIFPHVSLFGLNSIEGIFCVLTVLSAITVVQRIVFAYRKL